MKILIVGLNFFPELTGVGKYTGEMAEWLARRGHRVTIITAPPYYPSWRIGFGYRSWAWRKEHWQGCTVTRCPLYVPRKVTVIRRVLHLMSFAVSCVPAAFAAILSEKPDVVIAVAPTLLSAPVVLFISRATGAKSWLHIQDFEAEAVHFLGKTRIGLAQRVTAAFERSVLKRYDIVSSISPRMVERLVEKGVAKDQCFLFPNGVDCEAIRPLDRPSLLRQEWGIADNRVVALYSGSMGEKHGLEMLVDAARRLAANHDGAESPLILLVGNGPARMQLEAMAHGLSNLRFVDLQPVARLNELLNLADIHLLPQRADVADLVMPSKLGPMLASGRPVVATAAPGTQLAEALVASGVVVPPGDTQAFAEAIRLLAADPLRRHSLGEAARTQAEAEYRTDEILERMESRLIALGNMETASAATRSSHIDSPHDHAT
jgi:colanic acid biosynthesis glycosyl transferase WcaI